jgi:itaconate CoA-transferase
VPYGPFPAGDGGTVFLSVQNEREFARFCDVVLARKGLAVDPRFASAPKRLENRDALHAEIERVFAGMTTAEVIARLDKADIANARLNGIEDFWHHPQLEARQRRVNVPSPGGPIEALKPPLNLDGFEPRMGAVPAVGEHTRAILAELGYAESEIAALARDQAI